MRQGGSNVIYINYFLRVVSYLLIFFPVPVKPKFTDQLITGKGLPEMTSVNQATNEVITKAASLDLPSPTKANIPPLEHKQNSLDTGSGAKDHRDCFRKAGGDFHPTKLGDTHFSVKEPESPSHTQIDKVRKSPGKVKGKGNCHKVKGKKSPNGNKPKDPQRKTSLSLSDLWSERKAAVTSKLKRKFSRSDSEIKDPEVVARRLHVGKATFYNTESLENVASEGTASSNSETGSNSDVFESSGTSSENTKEESNSSSNTVDKEKKSNCISALHVDSEGTEPIKPDKSQTDSPPKDTNESDSFIPKVDNNEKNPCDEDVYEHVEYSISSQELYLNAEIVTQHEKGTKKLIPIVPVIEIEGGGTESSNTIGPSHDYMPMNARRTNMDRSTLRADVYDNAEFSTKMYDNSLYEKTESVYEAYEFHKARELREISRRSKFRKTAKKQKAILLEDDKYEPVNDRQVEGKDL